MADFHVVVYSAPLPRHDREGRLAAPGFLYFVSTPTHRPQDYEVYVQYSLTRYPMDQAAYLGVVGALHVPLPARPLDYEVADYYGAARNGAVDCYLWRPYYPSTFYAFYELADVVDPAHWRRGSRYVWRGFRERAAMGSRLRVAGMRRFYNVVRVIG